jgi:hypothetical protein
MVSTHNSWISGDPGITKRNAVREAKNVNVETIEMCGKYMKKKIPPEVFFIPWIELFSNSATPRPQMRSQRLSSQ